MDDSIDLASGSAEKEPRKLPRKAIMLWRVTGIFQSLLLLGGFVFFGGFALFQGWQYWWFYVLMLLFFGALIFWLVVRLPELKWQAWSYLLNGEEIQLENGVWIHRKLLVPMKRVQHVDTRQGPIQKQLGLARLSIYTAATTHEIPALEAENAYQLRDEISVYTWEALEQYDL